MNFDFPFSQFLSRFATEELCFEEIRRLRYPSGIVCNTCDGVTKHYKTKRKGAYVCKFCRTQVYPLKGTIFEKTSTPLRIWFYCMYLMVYTRAGISIKQLESELGVTYKTAWRMYTSIKKLMQQNNGDLLQGPIENNLLRWTFFNRFELKVVEKQETRNEN